MVVEPPVLTVFSLPRAFAGHSAVIQRNAIASWLRLPNVEVILLGEEEGLADTARTLGARHELKIGRNRHGTPMVSDAFARIRGLARSPYLAFVNADIILTRDFTRALEVLFHAPFQNWLAVGQRYDLDQHEPIGDAPDWESALRRDVSVRGILHGKAGLDYFLFPKDLPIVLPPLAVGRPGWEILSNVVDRPAAVIKPASSRSSSLRRSCRTPSMNVTPARTSGSKCAPLRRRHRCWAISSSL